VEVREGDGLAGDHRRDELLLRLMNDVAHVRGNLQGTGKAKRSVVRRASKIVPRQCSGSCRRATCRGNY
jgi:hypothetical protein